MRRFYRLDVPAPIYSGNGALSSEWGRIGCAGQVRTIPYPTAAGAHEALAQQRRMKERRGYASAQ